MKLIFYLLLIIKLSSCNYIDNRISPSFIVKHKGSLNDIMLKGDLSTKANLKDIEKQEHIYALGTFDNLKGEILILDSKVFNTYVDGRNLIFDDTYKKNASLLVYANVETWVSYRLIKEITTYQDLEYLVEEIARQNGIDINKPFPFLIEGKLKSFDWHVINWKDGDEEHSHKRHINSGLHGTLVNKEVILLGFYSNSQNTIFTNPNTNMHIHVKTKDNLLAAHLDDLTIDSKSESYLTLKIPYNE